MRQRLMAGLGVEPRGRLVEEEHLRPVREGAGDHQALGEPARELEDHRGRPLAECELLEQLVGAVPGRAAGEAEEAAVVVEVLPDRERAVERVRLRDDPDPALRRGRVGADVDPGDERAAAGGDDGGRQHPDRRRLAGPVRAEQPEELAGLDLEIDAVDGRHRAGVARKDLAEPLRPDRRLTPRRRRLESRRDRHRQRLPAIAAASARPRLAANAPPRCIPTRLRDGPPPGGQRACGARAGPGRAKARFRLA